jgi:hypothetical protein
MALGPNAPAPATNRSSGAKGKGERVNSGHIAQACSSPPAQPSAADGVILTSSHYGHPSAYWLYCCPVAHQQLSSTGVPLLQGVAQIPCHSQSLPAQPHSLYCNTSLCTDLSSDACPLSSSPASQQPLSACFTATACPRNTMHMRHMLSVRQGDSMAYAATTTNTVTSLCPELPPFPVLLKPCMLAQGHRLQA